MAYFINFNDTLHKFLSIKTIFINCDTIYTQFINVNDTIFSIFKFKNDMIYKF